MKQLLLFISALSISLSFADMGGPRGPRGPKAPTPWELCLEEANEHDDYRHEVRARHNCHNRFYKEISFSQCLDNANGMPDDRDGEPKFENHLRRECYNQFRNDISYKQCIDNAEDTEKQNGHYALENVLRRACFFDNITRLNFGHCIKNASKMEKSNRGKRGPENAMRRDCVDAYSRQTPNGHIIEVFFTVDQCFKNAWGMEKDNNGSNYLEEEMVEFCEKQFDITEREYKESLKNRRSNK